MFEPIRCGRVRRDPAAAADRHLTAEEDRSDVKEAPFKRAAPSATASAMKTTPLP